MKKYISPLVILNPIEINDILTLSLEQTGDGIFRTFDEIMS